MEKAKKGNTGKGKYYVLEMFSYPSAAKLHMGHWYNYGPSDSFARFKKMQGYDVFQPMGFDAFGLPAENYAIKTGIHPQDSTRTNIATMEKQLAAIGGMFDWDAEIKTCEPGYYRWTQWLFVQLFNKGLAYQKESPVNWCPDCNTVIANEQVVDGACERCHTPVTKKFMKQWFFRITDYAEELLSDLDTIDWPEKTKLMQRNWIGKSTGSEIIFPVADTDKSFRVFTTRADTLFGATYCVLAPEHPLVNEITAPAQKEAVRAYQDAAAKASEIERLSTVKEKTGVFTGAYAVNPANNAKIPVYIADYVLATYGTGAVMAVPAHDERDFEFATKYKLPIVTVVLAPDGKAQEGCFTDYGVLTASGAFDGLKSEDAKLRITKQLAKSGQAELKTNYRLRDWSVSRQRYWGCPIPVVYCPEHGAVTVPESELPVLLPYDVDFKPSGKSPLIDYEGYMNTVCPVCGKPAKRDPDTLDTFVCSSWYFLRFPYANRDDVPFDKDGINDIMPVDKYIGGAEHACMHLLYARFVTKALRDMGWLKFGEPFKSLVHQGIILGTDGNRMSKSRGNVISPDSYVETYGADVLRMYLLFGFSYIEGGPWSDDGIKSVARFLERIERLTEKAAADNGGDGGKADEKAAAELKYALNYAIKHMTADMETFSFNTAVARLMELINALYKYDAPGKDAALFRAATSDAVKLLAPLAPSYAARFWQTLNGENADVFSESYPICDEKALVRAETEYAVQINSKVRARINVPSGLNAGEIQEFTLAHSEVAPLLNGAAPKKVIVIPGRLVNILL